MSKITAVLAALGSGALVLVLGGCGGDHPMAPKYGAAANAPVAQAAAKSASSVKGAAGEIPAFYDGRQVTINSVQLSDVAGEQVGSNPSHNEIFVTNDLDDPQDFDPVLDAIQGDSFNPLWEQIKIVFNPGVTPRQFHSDDEVRTAAAGSRPDITLVDTHEVYRCAVVGAK